MISVCFGYAEKSLIGSLTKTWAFHCEKVGEANTLFSVVFGGAGGVQSSDIDKKQAATRRSAPCGKLILHLA